MELEKFMFDLQLFGNEEGGDQGDGEQGGGEQGGGEQGEDTPVANLETRYQFRFSGPVGKQGWIPFTYTTAANGAKTLNGTVVEQTSAMYLTKAGKGKYNFYIGAAISSLTDGVATLVLGPVIKTDETGKVYDLSNLSDAEFPIAGINLKINAPAGMKVSYAKAALAPAASIALTVTNAAAGSTFTGLEAGDMVTTADLAAGEKVYIAGDLEGEASPVAYTAAAKGKLVFVGETTTTETEGEGEETEPTVTNSAVLLSGTVMLAKATSEDDEAPVTPSSIQLAGDKTALPTDDVKVINFSTADDVAVKVVNGKAASITGLTGGTVVVTNTSFKLGSKTLTGVSIAYTSLNDDGTMFCRTVFKDTDGDGVISNGETVYSQQYAGIAKAGGELLTASYKDPVFTNFSDDWTDVPEKGTANKVVWYGGLNSSTDEAASTNIINETQATEGNFVAESDATSFMAMPGKRFLKVTGTTDKDGVVTIKTVEVWDAAANGALKKATGTDAVFKGTLDLGDFNDAVVKYTLPKNGTFDVVAAGVSYKSQFTNLGKGDKITTAKVENLTKLTNGKYYIYKGVNATEATENAAAIPAHTEIRQIDVANSDGVYFTTDDEGKIKNLYGLDKKNEKVTITETTDNGLVIKVYEVKKEYEVIRTTTAADGTKTVETLTNVATIFDADGHFEATGSTDLLSDETADAWNTSAKGTIVNNFDFTMNKGTVGYFAADTSKVSVGSVSNKTVTSTKTPYIAVEIDADGSVKSVAQKILTKGDNELTYTMADYGSGDGEAAFAGTITINAPAGVALKFDRGAIDDTTIESDLTAIVIKNAAAGSEVTLADNDTLITAKLKVTKDKSEAVTINGKTFAAGANNTSLTFTVKEDAAVVLTGGTAAIDADGTTEVIVGSNTIAAVAGTLTVTANGNSFTIGDLDEGESFSVGGVTYIKTAAGLINEGNNKVYDFKGNTVTKGNLEKASNWKDSVETYAADGTSKYGNVTVNLANADSSITKNRKAMDADETVMPVYQYTYTMDTRISKRDTSTKAVLNTNIQAVDEGFELPEGQTAIGSAEYVPEPADEAAHWTYTAAGNLAQTITVTDGWTVTGSEGNDTINGAAKGKDIINGSDGDDTINLKGAADTVVYGALSGKDTLNGYTAGKDTLKFTTDPAAFILDTAGANVYLADNEDISADETNYIKLTNVAGKVVTIGDKNYYFGNGKKAANARHATAGATFAYDEKGVYYANDSGKNTVKVGTLKQYEGKTTAGDELDITNEAFNGTISTIDASSSANKIKLTTGAGVTTLKGGTYQSTLISAAEGTDTLIGGSGADFFDVSAHAGDDVIKNYTAGKDKDIIKMANVDLKKFKVSGSNVVYDDDENSVTIVGAANKALSITQGTKEEAAAYYVGKSGKKTNNTFTYVKGGFYAGNEDTSDVTGKYMDTLKVTISNDGKEDVEINLGLPNCNSIEAVDASGVKAAKNLNSTQAMAKAGVKIISSDKGSRITGTKYNDRIDLMASGDEVDYLIYNKNAGTDTIKGFGVDDVVKFNNLTAADYASVKSQVEAGKKTITVGSTTLKFEAPVATLHYDTDSKTITGIAAN